MMCRNFVRQSIFAIIFTLCFQSAKVKCLKRVRESFVISEKLSNERDDDPFDQFAQFIIRSAKKGGEIDKYSSDEVRRSVKKLAAGQETLKSMDGAAHQLRSTFSDRLVSFETEDLLFEDFTSG